MIIGSKAAISVSTRCLKKLKALVGDARIDFSHWREGHEKGEAGGTGSAHKKARYFLYEIPLMSCLINRADCIAKLGSQGGRRIEVVIICKGSSIVFPLTGRA